MALSPHPPRCNASHRRDHRSRAPHSTATMPMLRLPSRQTCRRADTWQPQVHGDGNPCVAMQKPRAQVCVEVHGRAMSSTTEPPSCEATPVVIVRAAGNWGAGEPQRSIAGPPLVFGRATINNCSVLSWFRWPNAVGSGRVAAMEGGSSRSAWPRRKEHTDGSWIAWR